MVSPVNYPQCRAFQQLSPEYRLQVGDLVDEYELALETDPSITPEEICQHKPELLAAFHELLNQLKSIDQSLAAAIPLSPPVKIGDYDVLEQVGMGGSGVVFRCREQRINRDIAVKIFRPNLPPEEQKRRFLKETRITANFQDPGIPAVLSTGISPWNGIPCFWIAMEFVDGKNILDYVQTHNLNVEASLKLFRDVCEILQRAHRFVEVHRDLKPSNLLVNNEGKAYVLDFGIARIRVKQDDVTLTETAAFAAGTAAWMAPEIMLGNRADIRSDIFSLGVILFQMLTNHHPYDAEKSNIAQITKRLNSEPIHRLKSCRKEVSNDLDLFVAHLLELKPQLRYQNLDDVIADIDHLLKREPITVRAVSPFEASLRWCHSHALAATFMVLCLLLFFGGLAWNVSNSVQLRSFSQELTKKNKTLEETIELRERSIVNSRLLKIHEHLAEDPILAGKQLQNPEMIPPHLRDISWRFLTRLADVQNVTIPSEDGDIKSIEVAQHVPFVATIGGSSYLRLRDLRKDKSNFLSLGFVVDSDLRFSPDDSSLFAVERSGGIAERRTSDGSEVQKILKDYKLTGVMDLSDDGQRLIAISNDGWLLHYNLLTEETQKTKLLSDAEVVSLRFQDNNKIGGVTYDGYWKTWSENQLEEISMIGLVQLHSEAVDLKHASFIERPTGEARLAVAKRSDSVVVFSSLDQRVVLVDAFSERAAMIQDLRFISPSELLLATSNNAQVRNVDQQTTSRMIRKLPSKIKSCNSSSSQNLIALGTHDGSTKIVGHELPKLEKTSFWYNDKFAPSRTLPSRPTSLKFVQGARVFSGLHDGSLACIDLASNKLIGSFNIAEEPLKALCLTDDEKTLYFGSNSRTGKVLRIRTAELEQLFHNKKLQEQVQSESIEVRGIQDLRLSSQKTHLYVASRSGQVVKIHLDQWQVEGDWHAHDGGAYTLEVVADQVISGGTDGFICLWNADTGKLIRKWKAHETRIFQVIYHPELDRIYSVSHDESVAIWDFEGNLIHRMYDHYAHVKSIALSQSGETLATGAHNGEIFLWDALTGDLQMTIQGHGSDVISLLFTESELISASRDGSIKIWGP